MSSNFQYFLRSCRTKTVVLTQIPYFRIVTEIEQLLHYQLARPLKPKFCEVFCGLCTWSNQVMSTAPQELCLLQICLEFRPSATETKHIKTKNCRELVFKVSLVPPGRRRRWIEDSNTKLVRRTTKNKPKKSQSSLLDGLKYPCHVDAENAVNRS
uniref:Uncharacterized protein n=1 Tax=Schistocephalus solidus TaxID=70667 RepID=A0A0V0J1B5_SCHSO